MLALFKRIAGWWAREKAQREAFEQEWKAEEERWETEIKPLPLEEAKRRAEDLLKGSAKFEIVTAPMEDAPQLEPLAPELRAFFTKYAALRLHYLCLDRSEIAPSEDRRTRDPHRFLRIGRLNYDNEEEFELAVKPGEEGVYVLGDEIAIPDLRLVPVEDPAVKYPSVYHLLLYEDLKSEE